MILNLRNRPRSPVCRICTWYSDHEANAFDFVPFSFQLASAIRQVRRPRNAKNMVDIAPVRPTLLVDSATGAHRERTALDRRDVNLATATALDRRIMIVIW